MGIPDADSSVKVPKREPCEVVVREEPTGHTRCVSRRRFEREILPEIAGERPW